MVCRGLELVGLGSKQMLLGLDTACSTSSAHTHRSIGIKDVECFSRTAGIALPSRARGISVANCAQTRARRSLENRVSVGNSRKQARSHRRVEPKVPAGRVRVGGFDRSASAGLASASSSLVDEDSKTEEEGFNLKEALPLSLNPFSSNEDEEDTPTTLEDRDMPEARNVPWTPSEEAGTLVSEVILEGDELRVLEFPGNEDNNPVNSVKEALLNFGGDGREFSLTQVGGLWKTGKEAGEAQIPDPSVSMYDVKEGVSPLAQWNSTELTMQHSQLARIATDVFYLQNAFAFFGGVRIVEALLNVYSTSPPDFGKLKELLNALDPLTISWLAYNLRKPIDGIVEVDPVDLQKVIILKGNFWEELHKFYERQWKIMATIAVARILGIVVSHVPTAEALTGKAKFLWDALMALPLF